MRTDFKPPKRKGLCNFFPVNCCKAVFICNTVNQNMKRTRRLVNVRSHMRFRPALIYIFHITVTQLKIESKIDLWVQRNRYTNYWLNYTMPCLIRVLTRSHTINKTTEKISNKINKKKKFYCKNSTSKLKST